MVRKFLFGASLAALLLFGISATAHSISPPSHQGQQQAQSNAVSGKVTSIAADKKSFSLEVTDNGNNSTMQFVLDDHTRVTGRVSVGTDATVQYQPTDDGKLLALNIAPKTQ